MTSWPWDQLTVFPIQGGFNIACSSGVATNWTYGHARGFSWDWCKSGEFLRGWAKGRSLLELDSPICKLRRMRRFCCIQKLKRFQLQGDFASCPLDPMWAPPTEHSYRLALCIRRVCQPHIFFTWPRPGILRVCRIFWLTGKFSHYCWCELWVTRNTRLCSWQIVPSTLRKLHNCNFMTTDEPAMAKSTTLVSVSDKQRGQRNEIR